MTELTVAMRVQSPSCHVFDGGKERDRIQLVRRAFTFHVRNHVFEGFVNFHTQASNSTRAQSNLIT